MNTSKLFKLAHKLTKKVIKSGDNYRVTFGLAIKAILSRAKIEIVQEAVAEGQEYHNPFSSNEDNTSIVEHNSYYNHVTQILEFGKIGEAVALGVVEQVTGVSIR